MVAVQVQATRRFERPFDLKQTNRHVAQVGRGAGAVNVLRSLNQFLDGLVVLLDAGEPFFVDVVFPRPEILVAGLWPVNSGLIGFPAL